MLTKISLRINRIVARIAARMPLSLKFDLLRGDSMTLRKIILSSFTSSLQGYGLVTAQNAPARHSSLVRPASLSAPWIMPNRARSAFRTCLSLALPREGIKTRNSHSRQFPLATLGATTLAWAKKCPGKTAHACEAERPRFPPQSNGWRESEVEHANGETAWPGHFSLPGFGRKALLDES